VICYHLYAFSQAYLTNLTGDTSTGIEVSLYSKNNSPISVTEQQEQHCRRFQHIMRQMHMVQWFLSYLLC